MNIEETMRKINRLGREIEATSNETDKKYKETKDKSAV